MCFLLMQMCFLSRWVSCSWREATSLFVGWVVLVIVGCVNSHSCVHATVGHYTRPGGGRAGVYYPTLVCIDSHPTRVDLPHLLLVAATCVTLAWPPLPPPVGWCASTRSPTIDSSQLLDATCCSFPIRFFVLGKVIIFITYYFSYYIIFHKFIVYKNS